MTGGCLQISSLENWQSFSLNDLLKTETIVAGEQKVRCYLKFLQNLGLIIRINGTYTISNSISVNKFFTFIKENNNEKAELELKSIIKENPFFQLILNKFFFNTQPRKVSELREFLQVEDGRGRKIIYYDLGSKFFSKFLHNLGFIEYNQRAQTIRLNKGFSQIKIYENVDEGNNNLIEININCNGKKSKINLTKAEIIKWVLTLPEAEKIGC